MKVASRNGRITLITGLPLLINNTTSDCQSSLPASFVTGMALY